MFYKSEARATGTERATGEPLTLTFTCGHRHLTLKGTARCARRQQAAVAKTAAAMDMEPRLKWTFTAINKNRQRRAL